MKKYTPLFLTIAAISFLLAGCGPENKTDSDWLIPIEEEISENTETQSETVQQTAEPNKEPQEGFAYEKEVLEVKDTGEIIPAAKVDLQELLKEHENNAGNYYAFSVLEPNLKNLYLEILLILQDREENIDVTSISPEEIDKAFQYVLADHPEIFYVKGYTYTKFTRNDVITRISFSGTYSMTEEEIAANAAGIEQYVNQCLSGILDEADDYGKVKYIYEYLIANTEYQLSSAQNQNICSVFLYGQSVCQGYAKAMQYLLNKIGVPTTMVTGTVDNGEGHAWNLVNMNGAYYYVDATWGDAFYEFDSMGYREDMGTLPTINYDYLGVTTEQLMQTHQIDSIVPMPRCVSAEDNYYVRENVYFTGMDEEKVKGLFEKAYLNGMNYVTLKCSSYEVYQDIMETMITKQTVFQYLRGSATSVAYTSNEPQLTISFWLS